MSQIEPVKVNFASVLDEECVFFLRLRVCSVSAFRPQLMFSIPYTCVEQFFLGSHVFGG